VNAELAEAELEMEDATSAKSAPESSERLSLSRRLPPGSSSTGIPRSAATSGGGAAGSPADANFLAPLLDPLVVLLVGNRALDDGAPPAAALDDVVMGPPPGKGLRGGAKKAYVRGAHATWRPEKGRARLLDNKKTFGRRKA